MEYAISTHCLAAKPLDEALSLISRHTNCVEIMSSGLHFLENAEPLASYDCKWSIHAPTQGVNPASVLEPVRKASTIAICDTIAIAAEVGGPVVFHPGNYAWEQEREASIAALTRSLAELNSAAEEYGVELLVENMGNWGLYYLQSPDDLPLFGDIKFCLDIGHANECKTLDAFLDVSFSHIHLHDNCGKTDTHSAVGEGTIDFARVLAKIAENRVMHPVIECGTFEGVEKSLEALHKMEKSV